MKGPEPNRHDVLATGTSDDTGTVTFEDLPAGRVLCEAGFVEDVVSDVVMLVSGETTDLVLQSVPRGVLVYGTVVRQGRALPRREVVVQGRDDKGTAVWARMKTDDVGTYRGVIRPGSYRLLIAGGPSDSMGGRGTIVWWSNGGAGPWLDAGAFDLRGDEGTLQRDATVPATRVSCTVRNADSGEPIAGARLFAHVLPSQEGPASLTTNAHGELVFEDLPFGKIALTLEAKGFVAPEERTLMLTTDARTPACVFALQPAARLVLSMRDINGQALAFGRVARPRVLHVASERRFDGKGPPSKSVRPPTSLVYAGLPPGDLVIALRDRAIPGGVAFGPVGPAQRKALRLEAGDDVKVVFDNVRRRACVMVGVDFPVGDPDPDARIVVVGDGGRIAGQTRWVRPHRRDRHDHWMGFLVPGQYRLLVTTASGLEWTEDLDVGVQNIERRLSLR